MGSGVTVWAWMPAVLLLITQQYVKAYQITVQNQECLSQFVELAGSMVSGSFVVVERRFDWSALKDDIEMVATGPSGDKLMSVKARGGQKFQFRAMKVGYYKICFINPTPAPELVEFSIHLGYHLDPKDVAKDEHFDPVEAKIAQLHEALEMVALEQQYYKARDLRHKRTNQSTQNRLMWYSLAEYIALIIVSLAQVYLIRRLFSKRIGYNKV